MIEWKRQVQNTEHCLHFNPLEANALRVSFMIFIQWRTRKIIQSIYLTFPSISCECLEMVNNRTKYSQFRLALSFLLSLFACMWWIDAACMWTNFTVIKEHQLKLQHQMKLFTWLAWLATSQHLTCCNKHNWFATDADAWCCYSIMESKRDTNVRMNLNKNFFYLIFGRVTKMCNAT